jgi:hypothetical protein
MLIVRWKVGLRQTDKKRGIEDSFAADDNRIIPRGRAGQYLIKKPPRMERFRI